MRRIWKAVFAIAVLAILAITMIWIRETSTGEEGGGVAVARPPISPPPQPPEAQVATARAPISPSPRPPEAQVPSNLELETARAPRGGRGAIVESNSPVPLPLTDETFAKGKIQELVKEYCDAFEAIDPVRVQRVYPRIPMDSLRIQLNTSKYKSVQCKFGELKFVSLDPAAGTGSVQAELKRVYEHTILTEKPQTSELIADIKLFRSNLRSPWLIDAMTFKPK